MATSNSAFFRQRQRLLDPAGFAGERMAEVGQHVLEQHADHQLILDHEDALTRSEISSTSFEMPSLDDA